MVEWEEAAAGMIENTIQDDADIALVGGFKQFEKKASFPPSKGSTR